MIEIQALTPKHPLFLAYEKTAAFSELYNSNTESISHEVGQLKRLLERAEQNTLSSLLKLTCFLKAYKEAFQEVYRLLLFSHAVTSAACERSLSALKLIKS